VAVERAVGPGDRLPFDVLPGHPASPHFSSAN
jgi:hypothetical protein